MKTGDSENTKHSTNVASPYLDLCWMEKYWRTREGGEGGEGEGGGRGGEGRGGRGGGEGGGEAENKGYKLHMH